VSPYVSEDIPGLDLAISNVTTVDAERTCWDKVVILHGLRRWFDRRGVLRGGGQRVSRHYYDIYRLLDSGLGAAALANEALGRDCVRHARMFFNDTDLDLASTEPGRFTLMPSADMLVELRRDYQAMSGMIFGPVPRFAEVMASITSLEKRVNTLP
jgi:Nucleotidyl transferase AbiEii toxin, Type IV TA system